MKFNGYFKKSLSKQFVFLMGVFLLLFIIGAAIIFFIQNQNYSNYIDHRAKLVQKEKLAMEVDSIYDLALSDIRGYFAFGNVDLKISALTQHPEIRKLMKDLEKVETTDEDRDFFRELRQFTDYYFLETVPPMIRNFESGDKEEMVKIANSGATDRVTGFLEYTHNYIKSLNKHLDDLVEDYTKKQSMLQLSFVVYLFFILFIMFQIIRIMFRKIGQPLGKLAFAANQIANGQEASIEQMNDRNDELGALSIAFNKMIKNVQENEQNLLAQNEELIAQQEELNSQQISLEEAIEALEENEGKLRIRNELINSISNSLNKREVLQSIAVSMSKILEADKSLIVLLDDATYGSFGVSANGVEQFRTNLSNGLLEKLYLTKSPFSLKREIHVEDKGYHESKTYCYDLYLPVPSSNQDILAVMVLSRFGGPFLTRYFDEYHVLGKQIGISIEKINLYEETEENRRLNQNIMNTIQEGIQLVDSSGIIIQINEKLRAMLGKQHEEIISLQKEEWIRIMQESVVDKQSFISFFESAVSLKTRDFTGEFIYQKENGQVFKVYCENQFQDNEKVGTVFVHRDMTKEFEVDRIKSEFVSTVSHELRTPLASILGFTELLMNRKLKEERQKKYLTTIYNESKRLTSLINDFLDVQRMEAGKQTYEKKYVELLPIINQVVENQRVSTLNHKITCVSDVKKSVILGDKSKLEQVFTNLISNAIKYSPNGGEIKVRLYNDKEYLKVSIQDEGLGIPDGSLDKLFVKFYRIDNSDRRSIGGTGLGLAIVKEIMKGHDGEVSVDSVYGKGSTFTVAFPAVENNNEYETITERIGNYKVLVVEDDQSLANLIGQELNESGFEVVRLFSGKAIMDYLASEVPDAIVLDILLEDDIDGWSILRHLKEHEELSQIPVIVSTALDEKEKGFALGADDYLIKPYKPSQLSRATMQTLLKVGKIGQILVPEK